MSIPAIKFLLASQSPRRRELLEEAGFVFEVHTVKVSEILDKNLNLDEQIMKVAETKAQASLATLKPVNSEEVLLLSADTVVVLGEDVLGKPKSQDEAAEFLRRLSRQTHSVKTGICFIHLPSFQLIRSIDSTNVTFRDLSPSDIQEYLKTGEWEDKAGAYAIQGFAKKFVLNLKGSHSNVVGLPLELVEKIMTENNWYGRCRKSK